MKKTKGISRQNKIFLVITQNWKGKDRQVAVGLLVLSLLLSSQRIQ